MAVLVTVALWAAVLDRTSTSTGTKVAGPTVGTSGGATASAPATGPVPPPSPTTPVESATEATIDTDGRVLLERTLTWTGAAPAAVAIQPFDATGIAGVPADVDLRTGRPKATLNGKSVDVLDAPGGGWQLIPPANSGPGSLVVTYPTTGTLHQDVNAPEGRGLTVIPLPPLAGKGDTVREVTISADNILNVSCPTPDGTVQLCGTRRAGGWLVKVPAGGRIVLAQVDLNKA